MANTTRDGNFVPGGSIGILEQFDLINSNPLVVALVDANGDQISSFGGGTQYTEGDVDASITGTAMMWEDAGNALKTVSSASRLPVDTGVIGVAPDTYSDFGVYNEDSSHTDFDRGVFMLAVRNDSLSTTPTSANGDYSPFSVDNKGVLRIDPSGTTTQPVSYGTTGSGTSTGALRVELPTNGTGVIATVGAVTAITNALPAGTNAIGKLSSNTGVTIGAVEIASAQTLATVTTVGTVTGGGIAHDGADSGNPLKIGFKAYSPDGTTPGTAVAEGDRTDGKSDLDGRQLVNDEHPRWWSYHVDGSSALTDATVQASPGAGFQTVITNICVSSGAATAMNMFLEEGSTKIFGPIYLEAVAGRGFCTPAGFKKHITAATAVTVTTSAAIAHSVDIQGYIQAI